jgi:hypothetical protein
MLRKSVSIAQSGRQIVVVSKPKTSPSAVKNADDVKSKNTKSKKKREGVGAKDVLSKALKTEFKARKREGGGAPSIHKAKFLQAQRRIRKDLGIKNRVDGETYIALGRVVDAAAGRMIERMGEYLNSNGRYGKDGTGQRMLTERVAIIALRSFFGSGRNGVWDQLHKSMHEALVDYQYASRSLEQGGGDDE